MLRMILVIIFLIDLIEHMLVFNEEAKVYFKVHLGDEAPKARRPL